MTFTLVISGPLDRRSGGYSYDVDLVAHLEAQGHEVVVWSLSDDRAAEELKVFLRDEPDVVIFDLLVQHVLGSAFEKLSPGHRGVWVGLEHLLAWHAAETPEDEARLREQERRFLEHLDAFLFNSEDSRREVAALRGTGAPYRPSVIARPPLGRVPETLQRPTGQGRLLFLANVMPRKNLHGLLEGLSLLQQRRPDREWSLTIAGGEPEAAYAARCRALAEGLFPRVRWAGWVSESDREELWRATDLLALPSLREGWGMAHAEALVRGIPSLAVPRGASLEVLGDAALWSEPEPEALSLALERWLDDTPFREGLSLRARHRAPVLPAITGFDALPAFWDDLARRDRPEPEPFSFPAYLEAKSSVDSRALHPRVLQTVFAGDRPRSVIELGGGTGTMARRLREAGLVDADASYLVVDQGGEGLAEARRLTGPQFAPGRFQTREADLLAFWEEPVPAPDLVIAHALLDLFDARAAAPALARMGARRYWLTHLFDGLTAWEPLIDPVLDDMVITAYHRSMEERAPGGSQGAPRSGRDWLGVLPQAGFRVLDAASSDWLVRPVNGAYPAAEARFLRCLLHFFRTSLTGRADVDQQGLAWWLAVREGQTFRGEATFVAHQFDLVAELV